MVLEHQTTMTQVVPVVAREVDLEDPEVDLVQAPVVPVEVLVAAQVLVLEDLALARAVALALADRMMILVAPVLVVGTLVSVMQIALERSVNPVNLIPMASVNVTVTMCVYLQGSAAVRVSIVRYFCVMIPMTTMEGLMMIPVVPMMTMMLMKITMRMKTTALKMTKQMTQTMKTTKKMKHLTMTMKETRMMRKMKSQTMTTMETKMTRKTVTTSIVCWISACLFLVISMTSVIRFLAVVRKNIQPVATINALKSLALVETSAMPTSRVVATRNVAIISVVLYKVLVSMSA